MSTNLISQTPIDTVLDKLQGCKPTGKNQWQALCPAHDDKNPSLSVKVGDDGKVLLYCQAGCATPDIVNAMDLQMDDLFPSKSNGWKSPFVQDRPAGKPDQKKTHLEKRIVATYDYTDESGELLYQVCRYNPKDFRQRRPVEGGGWSWRLNGISKVPYRLPELLASDPNEWLFITEGEKDSNTLKVMFRATATCSSGGTGGYRQWDRPEFIKHFKNRHCVIFPDCDDSGRKFSQQIATSLFNVAADVRVVHLPGLSEKQDISDWVDAGGSLEELYQLIEKTGLFGLNDRPEKSKCVQVTVGDVEPEPVEWLWRNRIPSGKLTIIGGDPGVGKSFLSLSIAAHVSAGIPFSDTPDCDMEPGRVILLGAEDDIGDTVRPRLDAMGANCSNVIAIKGIKQGDKEYSFDLGLHIHELESAIVRAGSVKLCIIDPVSCYIGTEKDGHSNTQIRGILSPLNDLAARHKVAIVCITHLNKNSANNSAIYRLMGSLAWSAAARAVWGVVKDSQDTEDVLYNQQRRLMLPIKCNLSMDEGTGLGFTIQGGAVVWDAMPIQQTAQDFYDKQCQNTHRRGAEPTARDNAAEWWQETLRDGPLWSDDVKQKATQEGVMNKTWERAKKEAGVISEQSRKNGISRWYVRLNDQPREAPGYE